MRYLEVTKINGDIDSIYLTKGDDIKNMKDVRRIAKDNKVSRYWDICWYIIVNDKGEIIDD